MAPQILAELFFHLALQDRVVNDVFEGVLYIFLKIVSLIGKVSRRGHVIGL